MGRTALALLRKEIHTDGHGAALLLLFLSHQAFNPTSRGTPNAWQSQVLASFATRMKQGEKVDTMEFAEVVTDSSGKYLRYAKAIAIQPLCLTCHGTADTMPEEVKARLGTEYPLDQATGYSVGELRGAVVITRPL